MIIAVDFDGTIADFARQGDPLTAIPYSFEVLKALKKEHELILWTCREDSVILGYNGLTEAVEFCRENGLEFDAVNESVIKYKSVYTRKPIYDMLIDDRNFGAKGIVDWAAIATYFGIDI